jgi:hypothetical protein
LEAGSVPPSLNFPQLDFVKPSSGFHPVTWERVRLLHEVSKRKEIETKENVALLNKTHKANEKLCFYCKKPGHFVRNCLKKKSDEKEKNKPSL